MTVTTLWRDTDVNSSFIYFYVVQLGNVWTGNDLRSSFVRDPCV